MIGGILIEGIHTDVVVMYVTIKSKVIGGNGWCVDVDILALNQNEF